MRSGHLWNVLWACELRELCEYVGFACEPACLVSLSLARSIGEERGGGGGVALHRVANDEKVSK